MSKRVIDSLDGFQNLIGEELGVSEWLNVDQQMINRFADATLDHQWIHTDEERAKKESPFGSTIAHGYLTVSLLPYLWEQVVDVQNIKMQVNYGIEKLKFSQAVVVGSNVRLVARVKNVLDLRGICKANIAVKLEVEGQRKPAYDGELVFLYHFN